MNDWRNDPAPDDQTIAKWSFAAIHKMMGGSRSSVIGIHAKLEAKFPGIGFSVAAAELADKWRYHNEIDGKN